jgi:uncharacterized membrane protein
MRKVFAIMGQFLGNTDERKLSLVRLCLPVLGLRRRVGMIAR